MLYNTEKIGHAYKSKPNLNRENQIFLLMITDGEKWHYLAVKKLSALLKGKTSKHDGDFYCLNCLHSYRTENKLKKHYNVCQNHDYCYVEMPKEDNKILKYNHGEKSTKVPFIIYADMESLLEKMSTCHNNPKKSSTTKTNKHTLSGYSLFTHCSFDATKSKLDCYRGKPYLERLCKVLKEHAKKVINYEKKEMIPLTYKENKSYKKQKVCCICEKGFSTDDGNKKYHKAGDHCHYTGKYRGAAHKICNLRYKTAKGIPVVFHNGSAYDYHFIIKELAKESKGQFKCLGENTELLIPFSVQIEKILDNGKAIKYKIKFIDSFRFMSSSLSNLVDNLSEGLHNDKYTDCKSYRDYMSIKDDQLIFSCFHCKKNLKKDFNKELIKRFANIYEFCNRYINIFVLLLRKGVDPYEYMDSWERFHEALLRKTKDFYSSLNMENITSIDYRHAKRVFKNFNNKNIGDYHDF